MPRDPEADLMALLECQERVTGQFKEWKGKGRMDLVLAYEAGYGILVEVIEERLRVKERRDAAGNSTASAWGGAGR